jgi:hypothetical protein
MDDRECARLESNVVKINLAGHRFDIPLGYLYSESIRLKRWPKPKESVISAKSFHIDALLPDIRPYSCVDHQSFEERGWAQKISIYIKERNPGKPIPEYLAFLRGQRSVKEKSLSRLEKRPYTNAAPGLLHYYDNVSDDDIFVVSEDEATPYFLIRCDITGEVEYPPCKVEASFGDDLELSYTYGRQHLSQWRKIDEGVRKLFGRFVVTAK